MKSLIIICFIVIFLIIIGLIFIGNKFYNLAINTKVSKDIIFNSKDEKNEEKLTKDKTSGENAKEDLKWFLNDSNYEDIYINSYDGLKLHGYKIKNKNDTNKWVITVHGYTSEGKLMSNFAKHFYEMGYNLLVPDLRGHGMSQGDYIGMGWDDRLDIISWINFLNENERDNITILHGISMGGATVMMTSGEELPSNLKLIIEDCGYTSVWDQFAYELKVLFKLPPIPFMNVASLVCKIRAGYFLGAASSVKQLAKAKVPILFIHGDKDDFVPFYMLDKVYSAANCKKEKLVIKGAGHAKAATVNPKKYWETVREFIDKNI